jgi:dolichol-phosphate mannosyltransferase/undecaprenyl-phosphate 4-deoxy-4-formamido-L-arabinose transferase
MPTPNPTIGLLILSVTDKVAAVTVAHHDRHCGQTNYTRAKLVKHFLHGILYNSFALLKLLWFAGLGCLGLSMVLSLYYLAKYLLGAITVSGFTTLVLLILFFSGINMFAVGILGEYLLRIIQEVRHMPAYTIRDMEVTEAPCKKSPSSVRHP